MTEDWRDQHIPLARLTLGAHLPRWEQSRDEQYGTWFCGCGKTFAPDDFEGYHRHLARLSEPSKEGR